MNNLKALAEALCKVVIHPTGSNFEDFQFACRSRGDAISCQHEDIKVTVSGFKLLDAKNWDDGNHNLLYPAVDNSGNVWMTYEGDVTWSAGSKKGQGHCVFGYSIGRDALLVGLETHEVEKEAIDTLLLKVDRLAAELFGDDLMN